MQREDLSESELREKRSYEEELSRQEKRYKERKMEGSPKLSRELCKKIFLKSLDDMEGCYVKLLKYTRDPNFLEKYKILDIELQD